MNNNSRRWKMKPLHKKEIVTYTNEDIEDLYIGALPSIGRYFSKACTKISNGVFKVEIDVPAGELYYHFFHGDSFGNILLDPNNIQNGAKNWHSITKIGSTAFLPITFHINLSFISQIDPSTYEFKAISTHSWIHDLILVLCKNHEVIQEIPFEKVASSKSRCYYKALVDLSTLEKGDSFLVKIKGHHSTYYLGQGYQFTKTLENPYPMDQIWNLNAPLTYDCDSLIYHCFPDRFNRVNCTHTDKELTPWGGPPTSDNFFGGNLKGIIDKIDYLKSLGITHLYLTPIFKANSNHRYNCNNFKDIDPLLGSSKDLQLLVSELHNHGIKIILDIVLNHCGIEYEKFQHVLIHQQDSIYKDWFIIDDFPVVVKDFNPNYKCWWNNGYMPEFNYDHPDVREYMKEICSYWIEKYDIDGWRIDVSSEMGLDFLEDLFQHLKKFKEDTILIGENWKDASIFVNDGSKLSGVTNYLYWWKVMSPFFCERKMTLTQLSILCLEVYYKYPHNKILNSWNILSSHDIPRFISTLLEKEDIYNAVLFQFILPGTPVIYYGDEKGLDGLDDPLNRKCMIWEDHDDNHHLFAWYKKIIDIYKIEPLLQKGHLSIHHVDEILQYLVLKRYNKEGHSCFIIMNFSPTTLILNLCDIKIASSSYFELVSQCHITNTLIVPAYRSSLLKPFVIES